MRLATIVGIACVALAPVAAQSTKIVIDGRLDEPGWASVTRHDAKSGVQVRLLRDVSSLYVGVTSPVEGFTSLCVGTPDLVRILHASAALGAVEYRRQGAAWSSPQKAFTYAMRDSSLSDAAVAARSAYFAEHGWVASTVRMGGGRTQEFHIDLTQIVVGARIALGYYGLAGAGSVLSWPDAMPTTDGCAAIDLVRGAVPASLSFDPATWLAIPPRP